MGTPSSSALSSVATEDRAAPLVVRARRIRSALLLLGENLERSLSPDFVVELRGARAAFEVGGEHLELGPGTFTLRRGQGHLVYDLAPSAVGTEPPREPPLTFRLSVPRSGSAGATADPIVAELRGGPVSLAHLGLQDGALGLVAPAKASLTSDVRLEVAATGETVSVDGSGKLHRLALRHPRLSTEPIEGLDLAWRGKFAVRLDGTSLDFREVEIDLGKLRWLAEGSVRHREPLLPDVPLLRGLALDVRFEVPLTNCQDAFDSLPRGLAPRLVGTRLAGSLAAKGHARFDTANLARTYDVQWDGVLGCRFLEVPESVRVDVFRKPFEKTVYTPEHELRTMTFGPGTEGWVPLPQISKFMTAGVLTCEDGRFRRHHGFDVPAIVRSLQDNLAAGSFLRGASTISMQLAKNLYLTREKVLARKLQEAIFTLYLEQELTKDEILELYFNVIEYGPMLYGIGPAAKHWFATSAAKLSLAQSMYLASILQNPKKQYFGPRGVVSESRMEYVRHLIELAMKNHLVSEDEADAAEDEVLVLGRPSVVAPSRAEPEVDTPPEASEEVAP